MHKTLKSQQVLKNHGPSRQKIRLTNFRLMFPFYPTWKYQTTRGFVILSGGWKGNTDLKWVTFSSEDTGIIMLTITTKKANNKEKGTNSFIESSPPPPPPPQEDGGTILLGLREP